MERNSTLIPEERDEGKKLSGEKNHTRRRKGEENPHHRKRRQSPCGVKKLSSVTQVFTRTHIHIKYNR